MRAFAKKWLWFLLGVSTLILVLKLHTANYDYDKADETTPNVGYKKRVEIEKKLSKDNDAGLRACAGDYDCPSPSTYCQDGTCKSDLTDESWYHDGGN